MEESEDLSGKETLGEEPINISGGVDLGQEHKNPEGMDLPLVTERQIADTGAIFNEEINGEDDELSFGSFQSEATSVTASSVKVASEIMEESNEPLSTENHLLAPDPEAKLNPRSGEDVDCVQNEDEIAHVEIVNDENNDDGNDEFEDFGDFNDGHSNFQEHDHANIESRHEQDTHIMDHTESIQVDHDCKAKSAAIDNMDVEESPGPIQDSFFVEEVEATMDGECNNYSHGHIEPTSSHDVFEEFEEFIENDFESNIAENNGTSSTIDACITSSDNNDIDVHPSSVHLDVTDACDEPNLEEMKTRNENDNSQELDTSPNLVNDKNNETDEETNKKKNCNDAILFDNLDDFGESSNLPHLDAKSNESEECGNEANGLSLEDNNNITNTKLDHVPYQDYSEFKDTSLPGSDKIQGNDLDSSIDFHEKQDIVMKNEVNDGYDKVPNLNDNNASIESTETNNEDIKSTGNDEENSRFGVEVVHVDDHNRYDIAPAANDETLEKFDDSLPTRNAEDDKDIADAKEILEEEIICSDDNSFGDAGESDNTTSRTKDHDSEDNREAMDSNDENRSNGDEPVSTQVDNDHDDDDDNDDFGDSEAMDSNDENHSNGDEPVSTQVDKDEYDGDDDDDFGDFEAMDSNDEGHSNIEAAADASTSEKEPIETFSAADVNEDEEENDNDDDDDDDFGDFEAMDSNDECHSNIEAAADASTSEKEPIETFSAADVNEDEEENDNDGDDDDDFGDFEAMDSNDEGHSNIEAAADASTSEKEPIETSSAADVNEDEENDNDGDDDDDFGDFEAMDSNDECHGNIEAAADASTSEKEPIETSSAADVNEDEENDNDGDDDDDFGDFEAMDSNDEGHSNIEAAADACTSEKEPIETFSAADVNEDEEENDNDGDDDDDDDDDDFGDFEAMDSNDEGHSNGDEPVSTQVDDDDNDDDFGDFEAMGKSEEDGHVDVLGKGTKSVIESAFVQSAFNRLSSLFQSEDVVVPIHNTGSSNTTSQHLLDVMTDIPVQQKEQLAESTSLHLHLSKLFDHTSTKDTPSNVFIDDRDQIWRYENELNVGGFQIDQKDDVEKALYDLVNVDLPTLAEIAADEEEELDQIHQETVEKEKTISSFEHQKDLQTDTASAGKFNQDLSTDTSPLPNNPTIVAIPSRKKGESQSLNNGDIFSAFDNAFESIDHAPPNDFHESEDENSFGDFNSTPAIQEPSLSPPVSNGKDDLFGAFSDPPAAPETEHVNDADAEAFGTFSRSPMPSEVLSLPKSDLSIAAPTLVADIPNDDDDDDDNFAAFHTSSDNGQESLPTADNHFEVPFSTNDAEIPSMLPPPAMNDVDFKSDNIVDFQNNNEDGSEDDDEDGFGAFNALSSGTAEVAAAEIPSMPLSMPPPPAMNDIEIVDMQNDDEDGSEDNDEDGFGAFNALSSSTAEAVVVAPVAAEVEIPSMPPPPAVDDVDVKSDNIVDVHNDCDNEDGFGALTLCLQIQ
ncbi:predicted protein [Chaetoceros tenuissimus]|uniref:Uncharacterized protein n=1 Tax=Chaetoceros tenuissimus TaxID=426638 RepID=A0AAD3H6A5_9STRA|nr:predicted protein [Chaetoceros tenuissimus]